MKKYVLILLIFALGSCGFFQAPEKPVLAGKFSWNEWTKKSGWKDADVAFYSHDPKKIEILRKIIPLDKARFYVFASSYCEICEKETPKLFDIFNKVGVPREKIKFFGVDEDLREPTKTYKRFEIESVPVVFITIDDKTVGSAGYPDFKWLDGIIQAFEKEAK